MYRLLSRFFLVLSMTTVVGLNATSVSLAKSLSRPLVVVTPFELINAVNALRASYGLPPYSVNSILMVTAQSQADFMAASGDVTHSGPDGIGLTDRLLAAGYPLAGDLSAGGFRAENISSGNENRTAQSVVEGWSGDDLHLNTMISPNLSEIGAGVAVANGRVYFVIDCALPTTGRFPPAATSFPGVESTAPGFETPIFTTVLSTPNSDGHIIHEVKRGESLWQLAIAYEVKIDEIKRLNNLPDDNIYPGNKLLIRQAVVQPMSSLTAVPSNEPGITPTTVPPTAISSTPILFTETEVASWSSEPSVPLDKNSIVFVTLGILVLALLGGGAFTWLGNRKKADN